eukprot:1195499-Amphidinium_carterae.2
MRAWTQALGAGHEPIGSRGAQIVAAGFLLLALDPISSDACVARFGEEGDRLLLRRGLRHSACLGLREQARTAIANSNRVNNFGRL